MRGSIGTEIGRPQEWPEQGAPLLWKCTELRNGYASVAIANGKVYMHSQDHLMGYDVRPK